MSNQRIVVIIMSLCMCVQCGLNFVSPDISRQDTIRCTSMFSEGPVYLAIQHKPLYVFNSCSKLTYNLIN